MIKIATNSSHLSLLMQGVFAQNFPADLLSIVNGAEGSAFSALPLDHLIFTGSSHTGHQIIRVAADNLTPVTLELGVKSPTIIAPNYSIIKAAQQLLFSNRLNAGQTCVAPDYLFVPEGKVNEFIAAAKTIVSGHYRDNESTDYTFIINDIAFTRLQSALAEAVDLGATSIPLLPNSAANPASCKLPPILLTGVTGNIRIMQEEIFGPILPIMTHQHKDQVLAYINGQDHFLALYLFSNDKPLQTKVINKTRSGGVGLNDAALQVGQQDMPFGGVGKSGMGL